MSSKSRQSNQTSNTAIDNRSIDNSVTDIRSKVDNSVALDFEQRIDNSVRQDIDNSTRLDFRQEIDKSVRQDIDNSTRLDFRQEIDKSVRQDIDNSVRADIDASQRTEVDARQNIDNSSRSDTRLDIDARQNIDASRRADVGDGVLAGEGATVNIESADAKIAAELAGFSDNTAKAAFDLANKSGARVEALAEAAIGGVMDQLDFAAEQSDRAIQAATGALSSAFQSTAGGIEAGQNTLVRFATGAAALVAIFFIFRQGRARA